MNFLNFKHLNIVKEGVIELNYLYPIAIIEHRLGFLCGYMKIPEELLNKDLSFIKVHGGITFTKDNVIGFGQI